MNKKRCNYMRSGFSFVEIVVATGVGLVFFGALIYFASTTRVETSKAENYLRALQIAQETLELVQSISLSEATGSGVQIFEGSLVDPNTSQSVKIPFHNSSGWQPQTRTYPAEYSKAWFYRKIRIVPVPAGIPNARFMRKLTVDVYWNENKTPDRIETIGAEPDRMRKLTLSTLLFDESEIY
ncbi:MAG: hypothetical protein CVV41_01165 [Candidatus Riflebacteria bacterium HGW-Riflebacteria-1]|nr:MAG: hypothetical protein CVV41_01165 [Candidatus Riflebacteria bacterium HGW-Riflebacteria-1]